MTGRDLIGIFNLVVIAGILGGITWAATTLRPADFDYDTLCIEGETPPHRAVVIDKTDPYTREEAARILAAIIAERDALAVGERLSLFELDERGEFRHSNRFSLCNPGSGEQVNPLYRNPDRVQARYAQLFDRPLQAALADLIEPKDAPASPVIEALARLAQEENFSPGVPGRRILLVSDMLQNSELFTVYGRWRGPYDRRVPPAEDIAAAIGAEYGDVLRGVEVQVLLIPREPFVEEQRGAMQAHWRAIFRELGVRDSWAEL
ncbi:MAG: hypothetical protein KIS81_10890 [Maricaulaceae bacterium]|nr:hypothetical protein [Maricaulaceae bacterium]